MVRSNIVICTGLFKVGIIFHKKINKKKENKKDRQDKNEIEEEGYNYSTQINRNSETARVDVMGDIKCRLHWVLTKS